MLNNSWLRLILVKEVTDVCLYIQIIKDEYNTRIIYLRMEGMMEYGMRFTMQMGRKYIGIQITPICGKSIDVTHSTYLEGFVLYLLLYTYFLCNKSEQKDIVQFYFFSLSDFEKFLN